jgi:predicted nucleic-acid-binding Zn-ribbon protein
MNSNSKTCPECGGPNLYSTITGSGVSRGLVALPELGGLFRAARISVVVCADCGLTRFYADPDAREKLPTANRWQRL